MGHLLVEACLKPCTVLQTGKHSVPLSSGRTHRCSSSELVLKVVEHSQGLFLKHLANRVEDAPAGGT